MGHYWGGNGKHQELADKLEKLVPFQGKIEGKQNRKLDKFRRASNAYYDLFNNGGGNRGDEIRRILKIRIRDANTLPDEAVFAIVDPVMDQIILDAAQEQLGDKP